MSQVKKLAIGGTFIIDGQEISGADAINAVRPHLGETTGGIINALQDGATVNYNSANNTISITGGKGKSIDDYLYAGRKASVNDSNFKKDIGATFHTKTDQFKRELLNLRHVFDTNIGSHSEKGNTDLASLRKGSGWFYTKDKDGNNVYLEGPANADRMAILKGIREYVEHYQDSGEKASKEKYNISGWDENNLAALRNYFANIGYADRQGYWSGLMDRIKTDGGKNLTDVDKETLRLMGFDDSIPATSSGNGSESNSGNGFGIPNDWKGDKAASQREGIGWKKGDDGRWQIVADPNNQYLTQNWWTDGLDFIPDDYKKGFLINGKLYRENEVYGNKDLAPYVAGWYGNTGKNWNDWYNAANNSGIRFVNDRIWDNGGNDYYGVFGQSFNPTEEYNEYLSPYFRNNNITTPINVADVTSQYESLPEGSKVFAYLDPTTAFNNRGVPTISYVYYNSTNKENPYTTDLSGLMTNLYGGSGNFKTTNYIEGRELGNRAKRRFALHRELNIPGSDNSILVDEEGNLYLGKWNQSAGNIRGNRITNMDLLNEMLANPNDPKWKNINLESLYHPGYASALPERTLPNGKKVQPITPPGFVGRKQGGTLPKLQYGGPIKNTNTTKTQKKTEESKTDIVKPHKLDGSDGKLDSWEKMQIAAAIGDAIGVGLSFGGVAGGVAGAATGVASTGLRFAADVKKDGLDWGDVKRGAINLGFDLAALPASFIPGADNIIKAKKLARTIKSIGQPVLKWLGTIGATTSTINIAKKWIEGESPTSQDLSAFISGLGAGAVAGKQWSKQLGSSRLAARQSDVVAKAANAEIPKSVKAYIGENKTLEYDTEALSKLVNNKSQKEVIKTIISDADAQGVKLDEAGARNVLDTFGVKLDAKGKLSWWIRKDGKWQWPFSRGEARVEYTMPKEQSSHGAAYYFTHPIARQRALGYLRGNKQQANLLNNLTAKEYNDIINSGSLRDHTIAGALRRRAVEQPEAFNFEFSPTLRSTRIPWQFGWKGFVARPSKWAFWEGLPTKGFETGLIKENTTLKGTKIGTMFPLHTATDPAILARRARIRNYIKPFRQEYSDPKLWQATMSGFYKKGGKIVKAQWGTTSTKFNYTDPTWYNSFDLTPRTTFSSSTQNGSTTGILNKELVSPTFNNFDTKAFIYNKDFTLPSLNPIINKPTQTLSLPASVPTLRKTLLSDVSPLTKYTVNNALKSESLRATTPTVQKLTDIESTDKSLGGLPGDGWKANWPNIDDTIRAGITARAIYHDRDLQRLALGKLYQRQFQTPQFDRAKYNYSDIEQGYNESMKPYLESRFVTSDARDSMAFKMNKAQQLSGLAGQKNAQLTQRKSQIDDTNRQIDATNEQARVQTANEKSQYLTNLNYQDAVLDSVTWNRLFSDVINPFGQQMSQQGRDAWNQNMGAQYQFDAQTFQRGENARIQGDLLRRYKDKWNALTEDQRKQYGDIETYAYTIDPKGYKEIINGNDIYRGQMFDLMRKYSKASGAGLFFKSGGTINVKTTNKNQRPAQEQIAINSAKSAKRSVDELSKALLKMLAQLTK